jgi:hypothetical protein
MVGSSTWGAASFSAAWMAQVTAPWMVAPDTSCQGQGNTYIQTHISTYILTWIHVSIIAYIHTLRTTRVDGLIKNKSLFGRHAHLGTRTTRGQGPFGRQQVGIPAGRPCKRRLMPPATHGQQRARLRAQVHMVPVKKKSTEHGLLG